jgi:hypothetical protein
MLCGECEDRFNKAETLFAGKLFRPYLIADESRFEYDEWLQYFIVSVNWRNLYLDIIGHVNDHDIDIDELQVLIENEAIMRAYLLDERQDIGTIENHLFFFGDIKSASQEISSLLPHVAMRTSYCGYTIRNREEKTVGTISNLLGIVMVTIYQKGIKEEWSKTQVHQQAGFIEAKDQHVRSIFGQELIEMMKNAKELSSKLSETQRQKINDKLNKNKEEYIKSLAFKQRMKDYILEEDS